MGAAQCWAFQGTFSGIAFSCTGLDGCFSGTDDIATFGTFTGITLNCEALSKSFGVGSFLGRAENCTATDSSFSGEMVFGDIMTGIVLNCTATTESFCNRMDFNGTAKNCTAGNNSFAGGVVTGSVGANAIIENCEAGIQSFGSNGFSGLGINLTAGANSFCRVNTGTVDGTLYNIIVTGGEMSRGTISGRFVNVTSTGDMFGQFGGTFSGYAENCQSSGGAIVVASTGIISGTMINCSGGSNSFAGHLGGILVGQGITTTAILRECSATGTNHFGSSTGGGTVPIMEGRLIDCEGDQYGSGAVWAATSYIDRCRSLNVNGGFSGVTAMDGMILRCQKNIVVTSLTGDACFLGALTLLMYYCVAENAAAGASLGGGATMTFDHCSFNKAPVPVNNIAVPNNTVDVAVLTFN